MLDAVGLATPLALRAVVAVVATGALWEGAEARAGCEGQRGGARQGRWRTGGEEVAQGGQGRRPCRRALRRA